MTVAEKSELEDLKMKARNWDKLMAVLHRVYEQVKDVLPPDYDHGALLALVAHPPHPLTPEEYVSAVVAERTHRDRVKEAAKDWEGARAHDAAERPARTAKPSATQASLGVDDAAAPTPPPAKPTAPVAPPPPDDEFTFDDDDPM